MFRKMVTVALGSLMVYALGYAGTTGTFGLRVLPPIVRGNLTLFPVVGEISGGASQLMTLDEGIRNGTVLISERGTARGLIRNGQVRPEPTGEVNRLVLINNSDRPLILLAGEVVTGGKQDRVIGMDAIVPAHSDAVDLGVFCVEHGRWTANSQYFGSLSNQMVQPSVRAPAMAERSQQGVWDNVAKSNGALRAKVAEAAPAIGGTTSYAQAMSLPSVQRRVTAEFGDYEGLRNELRKAGARGVVIAINGRIEWADIFADSALLQKYWEKLIRSYAAEALTSTAWGGSVSQQDAQDFLEKLGGSREVVETKAGIYRRSEITGDGYKVFTLVSLQTRPETAVHIAKMRHAGDRAGKIEPIGLRRR